MQTLRQNLVAKFTHLYPFYSGCGTFANKPLIKKLAGHHEGCRWAKIKGGHVLAPIDDYIGRAAYFGGDLDRKVTWVCSQIVRPGDTVLDIGANIGLVMLPLSRRVGPTGRIHAFEPNPRLIELLNQTIEHNKLENVTLHPMALGPSTGSLELCIPQVNAGAGSLVRNRMAENCSNVSVPVQTLSNVVTEHNIQQIDFLKIDVEGFEAQVFAGANVMFEKVTPKAILFELNDNADIPAREQPVMQLLTQHGYRFFCIPKCLVRMKLIPFDPANESQPASHDILAVQPSIDSQILDRLRIAL
ncbi:MAG: FkbM family methyltransferase [Phycisphaeraceae bacterium JB051]